MVFSSTVFLFFFLPACLLLYYVLPGKWTKNVVLLLFSLVFYAWGEPIYVILMILNILFNWVMGLFMEKIPGWRKFILIVTIVVDIGLLGFFKYYGFLVDVFNSVTGLSLTAHKLALPIGISFYTFQTLSYVIDLYRGKIRVQKNPLLFGLFVTMFPQLIAGPIVRYEVVENALTERTVSLEGLGKGMARFIFGLAKKVLLANLLGVVFESTGVQAGPVPVMGAWLGLIAFGLQLYFDFSGYSDMAIGLGKMFGFDFPENFDAPYGAHSVTDFWRRWHISLGSWFREYVYIPLGGNRVGIVRHILNIMIVWFLTGFWHGAAYNFILWGLYYGLLLIFEKYVLLKWKSMPKALGSVWTLLAVFLGWGLFLCDSMQEVGTVFMNLFGASGSGWISTNSVFNLLSGIVIVVIGALCAVPFAKKLREKIMTSGLVAVIPVCLVLLILSVAFVVTENYNPFLYFRF